MRTPCVYYGLNKHFISLFLFGVDMRLADFILRDMETILGQWEAFAFTLLPAAANMKSLALRDHAQQILEAVAKDLSTFQSEEAQREKSMGRAPQMIGAPETAAQTHALLRARSGFEINQLAAEYRALRASVLRQWMDVCRPEAPHPDDIIRFNEAIDQALAESVSFFRAQVDQARNLLLGMLGHDMRSPLQSIQMTAVYLAALNAGDKVSGAASHGAPDAPVRVIVIGEEEEVRFEVKNNGVAIEQQTLDRIFDPLMRGPDHENKYDADGNLGLGLYIAREVAKAHGGDIEARSDGAETVFAVRLPRLTVSSAGCLRR
jgi:signal transduction histidine kinase